MGINGNKEYLPHHRLGGTADSGDCYPGKSRIKAIAESLYDFRNSSASVARSRVVRQALKPLNAILKLRGEDTSLEADLPRGNDTVWRMTLDLNRILIYGKPDGSMSDVPQRKILTRVRMVNIAGQGRGLLAPQPFNLGVISAEATLLPWTAPAPTCWVWIQQKFLSEGVFGEHPLALGLRSSGPRA